MLTLAASGCARDCEGYSRRDFLRIGALGLGGLSLPGLLAARSAAAQSGSPVRDKSVVFLYLRGGPTQYETFDPKMTAPAEYRAMFGEVQTRLAGVTFGSHFPKLAAMADRLAAVRSFRVGTSSHGGGRQLVTTGGNPFEAPMGSVYASVAGSINPATGMPSSAVITPRAMGPQYNKLRNEVGELLQTGTLSKDLRAFDLGADGGGGGGKKGKKQRRGGKAKGQGLLADMQLKIPESRLDDRRNLLSKLDRLRRDVDSSGGLGGTDKFQQQAFDVIMGGVSDAFDLSKEDPRTIQQYDTARFKPTRAVLRKPTKNAKKIPEFSPVALGKQMLMARRLCESGCGFVTVTSSGWDMHGNAFGIDDGMTTLGPAVDHAVSVFLDDLAQRGLSDDVLLVVTGEMGRTPRINDKAGRDHWAGICPLLMAGGGLRMGQVIGQSDRTGGAPATDPISVQNLMATIMHTLFDIGQLRLMPSIPTEIARLITGGDPIRELV